MSGDLHPSPTVNVMRVAGITGDHAAANGDYYLLTDVFGNSTAWALDGNYPAEGGYQMILNINPFTDDGWILGFNGGLDPAIVAQVADDAAVATPADVVAWGSNDFVTVLAGAGTITVTSEQAPAIPVTIYPVTVRDTPNPLTPGTLTAAPSPSPGTAGAATVAPTLTPGTAGAATVSPTLSPGTPGALV